MRRLEALLLLTLAGLLPVGDVLAHAALVRSVPGTRSVMRQPPEKIELWFNEEVEGEFSEVSVEAPDGQAVEIGKVAVKAGDPYCLQASVPPLGPGRYTVRYRVLSKDGHVVEYGFQFRIAPQAEQ